MSTYSNWSQFMYISARTGMRPAVGEEPQRSRMHTSGLLPLAAEASCGSLQLGQRWSLDCVWSLYDAGFSCWAGLSQTVANPSRFLFSTRTSGRWKWKGICASELNHSVTPAVPDRAIGFNIA